MLITEIQQAEAEREIERLIAQSQPLIDNILSRYTRSRSLVSPQDAEDIRSTIHLRLVLKLRDVLGGAEESIRDFRAYVATLAYNVVNDHLRKRFPERARLKTRLRYALTHHAHLAMWPGPEGPLCGLAAWEGREDAVAEVPRELGAIAAKGERDTASVLDRVFHATLRPVLFDAVVDAVADACNVVDVEAAPLDSVPETSTATHAEDLDFIRALWSEILELRPMQRKALLLNLRYGGETNIISLLILGRIGRFDEIAAALEMSHAELAAIWRSLPMDDATIAARFGLTRQQVINLRKAARARLSRRFGR